jgi:hypothetical protein
MALHTLGRVAVIWLFSSDFLTESHGALGWVGVEAEQGEWMDGLGLCHLAPLINQTPPQAVI